MTGGMHAATSSRLRQKIQTLRAERDTLEEQLLDIRSLLHSSLIAHHTLEWWPAPNQAGLLSLSPGRGA